MKSIFIFHRDLRLEDHLGLTQAIAASDRIFLVFIFTPEQVEGNEYFSQNSFNFMVNSLKELSNAVKISFYYEKSDKCLKRLLKITKADAVWESYDFTPFAKKRQNSHASICDDNDVKYMLVDTITLLPMELLGKYKKFTPFYENAKKKRIPQPISVPDMSKINKMKLDREVPLSSIPLTQDSKSNTNKSTSVVVGGRTEALKLLKKLPTNYSQTRNFPKYKTSILSAHLHFGTISPREAYHAFKGIPELRRQLYWREFYICIVNYIATNYIKKSWTLPKMNRLRWKPASINLDRWKSAKTGIPIVDAGMQELLSTGYMHNRLRMIVAMFLIHYLGIHWKEGEKWFAQNLVDYDYCNNYGGWTWCAGIEVHSNPYFRIYSMEQQMKRFDPDAEYVKKWKPVYKNIDPKELYNWPENYKKYNIGPPPILYNLDIVRKKRIEYIKAQVSS